MRAVVIGLWLILLCFASSVESAVFHVRTGGDNTQGQGTEARPWKTIAHALLTVKAGDTVLIGPGRFAERLTLKRGGSMLQPVTLKGFTSADGTYQTVLDGSSPIEAEWQDAGNGVYKAQLGYNPRAMTSKGSAIWRCGDHAMDSGKCQEVMAYGPDHEVNTNIGGPIKYWDGIDALFSHQDGWTYLRFRNREHPRDMQVRAAPGGGVVTITTAGIVVEQVKIVGGEFAVHIKEGARGAVVQDSYLTHGKWRVLVEGGAEDTVIRRNTITLDGIGFRDANLPAGDWNNSTYARIVNRHRYDENKFLIGSSETDDSSIELRGDSGTIITENIIRDADAGITFHGNTSNAEIAYNQIYKHSDNCIYINADWLSASIHHNLIADCDHLARVQSTQQNMRLAIYANSFFQPPGNGKHVFLNPPDHQPGDSVIAIFQNSHAGTGWAVDVGSDGQRVLLPFVHLANLFISTDDLSSWGDVQWGSSQGIYKDNIWYGLAAPPDFRLPSGNGAIDSAQALNGAPGMNEAYYCDGRPDHGSTQCGAGITPPPHPVPGPGTDTQAPTVSVISPSSGARLSGSVRLEAVANDNTKVTSVIFQVDSQQVGGDGCCSSVDLTTDSTKLTNGTHLITAVARDAAGNSTTSAPVNVIVYNAGAPPIPPNPSTGPHPPMACTGTVQAIPGAVSMNCTPQAAKR